MIAKCGLAKGRGLRNQALSDLVDEAYKAYESHRENAQTASDFKDNKDKSHGAVSIKFLGVWDTVVALGFPKRTDITGPVTLLLNFVFGVLEKISDLIFPHSFYYYRLSDNVEYACQALAIDDERTAFWPYVWREKDISEDTSDRSPDNVEQVWFAGMHSNVGGGYERAGMAAVALYWMMTRAQQHGLVFNHDAMQQTCDASHVHGRMYNSRAGLASFYRYHPREIEALCRDKLLGNIRLHRSVIERLNHRTANYVPGYIPASFDVVDNAYPANVEARNPGSAEGWYATRALIDKLVSWRKRMYGIMLTTILAIVGYAIYLWNFSAVAPERVGFWGEVANIIDYFTPDMFDGLIAMAVVRHPYWFVATILLFLGYWVINRFLYAKIVDAGETLRHFIIEGGS